MTTKYLTVCMLAVTFALLSCQDSSSDTTAGEDMSTEEVTEEVASATSFKPVVLNDSIASPLKQVSGTIDGVGVTITYGSPAMKGRAIWGELVPFDEVWRTGANEATTIEFDAPVMIEDQPLEAGKYGFFTIPGEEDWTIIFNGVSDQWGAYQYDDTQDVLRAKVLKGTLADSSEYMDFFVDGNNISLTWGDVIVPFSVAKG